MAGTEATKYYSMYSVLGPTMSMDKTITTREFSWTGMWWTFEA